MYYFSFTSNFVDLNMTLTQNDFGRPLKLCPAGPIGNFFEGVGIGIDMHCIELWH